MKRTKRDQQLADYVSEMSCPRLSGSEVDAVKMVLEAGSQFGYGNMIAHLRTAWARMLMDRFDFSWDQAARAAVTNAYDPKIQDQLLTGT